MRDFSLHRLRAVWRRLSLLDRVASGIVTFYLLVRVIGFHYGRLPLQGFLAFLAVLSLGYLLVRSLSWMRTHVLWSLRNRLIVAYLFIAVVPVVLLLTMAGVGSYMLYLQWGAHLLHDDLTERVNSVQATAGAVANAVSRESAASKSPPGEAVLSEPDIMAILAVADEELPGIRVELNDDKRLLRKQEADEESFRGAIQWQGRLWIAAVVARKTPGGRIIVSAIVPVTPEMLDRMTSDLGPIQLTLLQASTPGASQRFVWTIDGRDYVTAGQVSSHHRVLGPPQNWLDVALAGVSTLDVVGERHGDAAPSTTPVIATFLARPSQLNHRLFTSLGALGPKLTVLLEFIVVTFFILELAALAIGIVLTRTITHAVADLYEATQHVRRGDFRHRIRLQRRDQLGVLAESFNAMTGSIAELIEEQRKRQRLENELSIAREVQEQLFPQNIPQIEGLQLAAVCRPARVVSGDYYDLIRLGPTSVGIALSDISGKGISAALLMASLQAALRSQVLLDGLASTAELVRRLNRHIFVNTSDDRYATFFYAVYDTASRTLNYTNAGHLAPFYVCGEEVVQLEEGGTVVGLFDECVYTQGTIQVKPGSVLVAYSDGLTEPENVYGEEFGKRRLLDEILRRRDLSPNRLAEDLVAAAEQWSGTPERADDMTVIVARIA